MKTQSRQDPNIICLLGEICLRQRRPQEAENWFRKVLRHHEEYPRALEGLGLAILADGNPKKASKILTRAVASENAIKEAFKLNPGKAAIAEAERATRDGRMEDAEKTLREILSKNPNNAKAIRMLGSIALEANRYRAARRLLERAVELSPGVAMSWTDLANLHLKKDRYDEALAAVQRAIDIDPAFAHSYVVMGNILTRAQRHEESLRAYQQALDVSPLNIGALNGMGHVLKTIGGQDEAIADFRKCIQVNPA